MVIILELIEKKKKFGIIFYREIEVNGDFYLNVFWNLIIKFFEEGSNEIVEQFYDIHINACFIRFISVRSNFISTDT